jgi:putative phage-type endonuclease
MLIDYKKMFCMISEMARIHNKYIPLPSHEDNQKKWFIQLHNSLDTLYLSVSSEEKEKLQKIETLFYSMYEQFLKYSTLVRSKEEIKTAVTTIFKKDQVEQRTEQWYDDMKQMITASEFSKLFDSERTRALMVFSKLQDPEKRNIVLAKPTDLLTAMDWGVRFEPLVRNYLETLWNCKIYESGRLKHATNTKLGASPDGIVVEPEDSDKYGRLVEIKCPYSREVGKKVPFEYWCQMQIQMEVANLNECEYVEVEIISRSPKNRDIIFSENDIVNTMYLLEKDDSYLYWYSNEGVENLLKKDYSIVEEIKYAIKKIYNVLIKRDVEWYEYTKKFQDQFWDDVERAKNGEYLIPEIKRKRNDGCLISDEK